MRIAMIGTGYVGLVSGACFADLGHHVTCVDHDSSKVESLRNGQSPIYEPGLDILLKNNINEGRLLFTGDIEAAVATAEIVFVAVGTPARRGDGHADLSYVYQAARQIARAIRKFTVVVNKSTVPLGTGDEVLRIMLEESPVAEVAVVSNPEFLREGSAIQDFRRPDRIVVGVDNELAREMMADLYRPLLNEGVPILFTSRRTAELVKYAANAFLALKVTFINEIADLAEVGGADVLEIARGIGLDDRIGQKFLQAGPGYGGSCLPKDTLALIRTAQDYGRPIRLVETTVAVNEQRKSSIVRKIIDACGGSVLNHTICILGLTFKPNTDDMRDAPAISIISGLQASGARIKAFDPIGIQVARGLLRDVDFAPDAYRAAEGATAIVVVTDWEQFRGLDMKKLRSAMTFPVLIDLRNLYDPLEITQQGFRYVGTGRPSVTGQSTPK